MRNYGLHGLNVGWVLVVDTEIGEIGKWGPIFVRRFIVKSSVLEFWEKERKLYQIKE